MNLFESVAITPSNSHNFACFGLWYPKLTKYRNFMGQYKLKVQVSFAVDFLMSNIAT